MYLKAMGGWNVFIFSILIFALAQLSEIGMSFAHRPSLEDITDETSFFIAVSLALRYWAGSYDTQATGQTPLYISNYWLSNYTTVFEEEPKDSDYWLKMYLIFAGVNLVLYGLRMGFFLYRGVVASRVIYTKLIARILSARIRFFDSTPTGRILNRLSKDIEAVDQDVSVAGAFLIIELFGVIGIIGTISVVLPSFLIAGVIITIVYLAIGFVYLASSRELKRFESLTKSPIIQLFGETLHGVSTIRSYSDGSRFNKQVFSLLDATNRPFFSLWRGNRWLSVRVDVAAALVTLAATIFVLVQPGMSAALAGFILSFAIAFNDRILWVVVSFFFPFLPFSSSSVVCIDSDKFALYSFNHSDVGQ